MKVKKILCVMLVLCMLIPFFPVMPVSAEVEWTYDVLVAVCDKKDAGCGKSNAIQVSLDFESGTEYAYLSNTGRHCTAYTDIKSSRAPWTIKSIKFENKTKDSLWMHYFYIVAKTNTGVGQKTLITYYYGKKGDNKTGQPIDIDDGGPRTSTVYFDAKRMLSMDKLDDFRGKLSTDIRLDPVGESGTETFEWSGKISDDYAGYISGESSYDCMSLSDAPTLTADALGLKGDGSQTSKSELEKNGITFTDKGFKMDKAKLVSYMNSNNLNEIDLIFTLKFNSKSTGGQSTFYGNTRIFRNVCSIESVNFSNNYFTAATDNYFYNDALDKTITVKGNIKTTGNYSFLGNNVLKNTKLTFKHAYLKAGDSIKLAAVDESGKEAKSALISNGRSFELKFPYEKDLDSENAGLTLVLEGAGIDSDTLYFTLWDEVQKKPGFSNSDKAEGYFVSTHKIDSKTPTVNFAPADGVDLNKWNKTVTLISTPSEDIYSYFYGTAGRVQGYYSMNLTDGKSSPVIYKYNYTEQSHGTAAIIQKVPALKGFSQNVTLALRDKTEGEYDLVLIGQDYAGNYLSTVYKGIKLDNKAPEVTVTETVKPKIDGKKGNIYNVKITDASGTGRLYYMFTKKSLAEAPSYDGSSNPVTSGDMDTTLDRWAYIEQKDTENGKTAAAYLDVDKGESFIGRLMYFATDEAGNKTDVYSKDININNEDTAYDITPKNVDRPRSSYEISVTTNGNNKVFYRWKNYVKDEKTGKMKENLVFDFKPYSGIIDTSKDEATKNLNGTYTLECKIVPPSNTNINYVSLSYVFDNEGPVINLTAPSAESYRSSQTVTAYAADVSELESATAKIVTPDGKDIDGSGEFALSVADGILMQNVNITDMPGGAYALKVTATDRNGISSTELSKPFFIRNSAPTGKVEVASSKSHNGRALIATEEISLSFDITEAFANPSAADGQFLYYRISTTAGEYGEWLKAGKMTASGGGLTANITAAAPELALVDGENTLFVQTAVCHEKADKSKIDLTAVKNDEIVFYYDKTAPTLTLVLDDMHTSGSIEGKLYASDNIDAPLTAACASSAVKIGEYKDGAFDITVSENTESKITVSDGVGNTAETAISIKGIDREAPEAEITVTEKMSGARRDAAATIRINDVAGESVKIAVIPAGKYSGGEIPEEYFTAWLEEPAVYKISVARSEESAWSGENNIIYNAEISGATGSWYIGVRAADSLGNSRDIVFDKNVLSAEDAELSADIAVRPMKTETRTVAYVSYNMPVYTLPQDKIADANSSIVKNNTLDIEDFDTMSEDEKVEAANLALAKQYAMAYSDKYTFGASRNGDYELYTADDLGRTKHLTVTVDGVEFGAASEIKAGRYIKEWPTPETYQYNPVPDGKMICAASDDENVIIAEPADGENDTLLLPKSELDGEYTNGLVFDAYSSEEFAVRVATPEIDVPGMTGPEGYEKGELKGYTKLVYRIRQVVSEEKYMPLDVTERMLTVRAFNSDADIQNPDEVSEKVVVIADIDNTAPVVTWTVSPEVMKLERFEYSGEFFDDWVYYPTPGNVTFTLSAQDKETGISEITAFSYTDENGDDVEVKVPLTDGNGNATEYWSWNGDEHSRAVYEWDAELQQSVKKAAPVPLTVEYRGDADPFGVKTLQFTFTDAYALNRSGMFINTVGAMGYAENIGRLEGRLSTEELICKTPIEEGIDYNLKYYFKNSDEKWEEISDTENTYYKNAKAVIEIPEGSRGEKRGLYVLNNSGSAEKELNNYRNSFTFRLKDKYGYIKDVPVVLEKFDTEPGTLDYTLSTTAKTNKPIEVVIKAADAKSGVGTVKLTGGAKEIPLTLSADEYRGTISQNGTYSITLLDRVGNKTVKSFNIKNINTELAKAGVTYSTKEYTSRPVTATIVFDKDNVRITNIAPVAPLTESDYTVNYNTSTVTFIKSGTVAVCYEDDYGNSNADDLLIVAVDNIDKTPPVLEAVMDSTTDPSVVSVTFNKVDNLTSKMDMERKESEIFATYGGITKAVADEKGNKNSFVFYQNGNYTFKVHDSEGLSSYLSLEITGIDLKAPKITSISWTYDYDEFDGSDWVTQTESRTIIPKDGTAGYTVGSDVYKVTNRDVTVKVETDEETRLVGSQDEYSTVTERVYDRNGMFIFNPEKKNGLTASYGVDIEIIDKTPPMIDLLGTSELVFYQNPEMKAEYDISMLKYVENGKYEAYKAFDIFNGRKTDLTKNVTVADWGGFNPDNLNMNKFDSSKPYTITYRVTDAANNTAEVKRTVRLVGMYDTVALVNGKLPDYAGRSEVTGDSIRISLANFAGTAYARYQSGVRTMGQMKKDGIMLSKNANGEFEAANLSEGWYTFYIQTDKRDYFTLNVYLSK